jgi:hypothetical protein
VAHACGAVAWDGIAAPVEKKPAEEMDGLGEALPGSALDPLAVLARVAVPADDLVAHSGRDDLRARVAGLGLRKDALAQLGVDAAARVDLVAFKDNKCV